MYLRTRTLVPAALLAILALAGLSTGNDTSAPVPPAAKTAGQWSRFRGPNGTGESDDKNVPIKFTEKENLLWKLAIPGIGHSSPIVYGDNLFMESASEDGKDRWIICVDVKEGTIRWK